MSVLDEILINRFVAGVNERIAVGAVPPCMQENPLLIGQVAHDVIEGCVLYLVACEETESDVQYIKIGLARNIKKRINGLATGCPLKIKKAMYFCVGGYGRTWKLEQDTHKEFAKFRATGEWFRFKDKEEKAEQVINILNFVEKELAEDYNSFVYDRALDEDPNLATVFEFAEMIWEMTDDKFSPKWLEDGFVGLSSPTTWGRNQ